MYKKYKKPESKAFGDIKVAEPRISKGVVLFVKVVARIYLTLIIGTGKVVLRGDRFMFDAFKRALAGESRCIIAFRHPYGMEPQILTWFFLFKLKKLAAKKGIHFARHPHALFVHGYEVLRWGGPLIRFVMPNMGAMPIDHVKMDSKGMARIYRAITDGPYPLALAPEGQISYSADIVPRLEPGVIRIGFSSAVRLSEKNAESPVEILPVSFHFRYSKRARRALERLLKKTEKVCGFRNRGSRNRDNLQFNERLERCRYYILELNEKRYGIKGDDSLPFETRLEAMINTVLEIAENMLGIKGEGDFFARMYKVRHSCWDRTYLSGVFNLKEKTELERNVLDFRAGEGWYIMRHQELIDFCWYFRTGLPKEDAPFHSKAEYVQNLWDFASRTMGGTFSDRVNIFPKKIIIQNAPAINLSERLSAYHEDKKAAIAGAMADLE